MKLADTFSMIKILNSNPILEKEGFVTCLSLYASLKFCPSWTTLIIVMNNSLATIEKKAMVVGVMYLWTYPGDGGGTKSIKECHFTFLGTLKKIVRFFLKKIILCFFVSMKSCKSIKFPAKRIIAYGFKHEHMLLR